MSAAEIVVHGVLPGVQRHLVEVRDSCGRLADAARGWEVRMSRRRRGIPGVSFSWKRALGISAAKARLSRQISIPLTRYGRQRKVGAAMGCSVPMAALAAAAMVVIAIVR